MSPYNFSSPSDPLQPRRRPPPDYTQRSVKLRLFAYLAGLMLVLALIEQVRNPQAWQWLWELDRIAAQRETFDSRLQDQDLRTAADPPGTIVAGGTLSEEVDRESAQLDPVDRTWRQGWREIYSRLSADERSLLFELLYAARQHQAVAARQAEASAELPARLAKLWDDYWTSARQSLAALSSDEQAQWTAVLQQASARYEQEARPALAAVLDRRTLAEAEERVLIELEQTLVAAARASIRDDTVVFRPAERDYWFHVLQRVRDAGPSGLTPAPRASYLQLAKQPDEYRGRAVTIAGTVRLAQRVPAAENHLGVLEYYVYWIEPAGGPNSPLVVYALDVPKGFPPLRSRGEPAADAAPLREDVEVTGVFMKRCAYAAQDGTYTAPLLLAYVPKWHPQEPLVPPREATPAWLGAAVAGALLLALCMTAAVWKWTSLSRRAAPSVAGGIGSLSKLRVGPSPEEALGQLEQEAREASANDERTTR